MGYESFWIGVGAFVALLFLMVWVGALYVKHARGPEPWERDQDSALTPVDDD